MLETSSNPLNGIGTEPDDQTAATLTLDEVFSILSCSRRRHALIYLIANDPPAAFAEIVNAVCEAEYEKGIGHVSGAERHRVYISLYQTHLPALEKKDVVSYERRSGAIDVGPNIEVFDELLTRLSNRGLVDKLTSSLAGSVAHF